MRIHPHFSGTACVLVFALFLGACIVMPTGPSMLVLPGTGSSIDTFRYDDNECRQFAYVQIGGKTAQQAANEAAVSNAVVGTAIGALAGAAIGGRQGAAVGAGSGLVVGSAYGSGSAWNSGYAAQRQYDNAYIQCMYSKGHRVPVPANMIQPRPTYNHDAGIPPPPPPPPPPGMPPPPPLR